MKWQNVILYYHVVGGSIFETITTKLQVMTISRVNCKCNQSESIVHCQLGHRRRMKYAKLQQAHAKFELLLLRNIFQSSLIPKTNIKRVHKALGRRDRKKKVKRSNSNKCPILTSCEPLVTLGNTHSRMSSKWLFTTYFLDSERSDERQVCNLKLNSPSYGKKVKRDYTMHYFDNRYSTMMIYILSKNSNLKVNKNKTKVISSSAYIMKEVTKAKTEIFYSCSEFFTNYRTFISFECTMHIPTKLKGLKYEYNSGLDTYGSFNVFRSATLHYGFEQCPKPFPRQSSGWGLDEQGKVVLPMRYHLQQLSLIAISLNTITLILYYVYCDVPVELHRLVVLKCFGDRVQRPRCDFVESVVVC
ncbi:hypothetical protein AGLY_009491 [Aphis glycines]|uniref:Uncharacterized protein n=1 Tax=Aphis glycines TaxID=307491 RepID=A0A6G0THN9_APHGL|nr:hypothetical protein AGLY_009491 [Aphis glycines]